jgi:hypothetical protein
VTAGTDTLLSESPQGHQKQAVSFRLHALQNNFSGIWNQRFLFHDKLPWDCQNLIFLPPNRLLGKYQLGFTKSAEEPKSS